MLNFWNCLIFGNVSKQKPRPQPCKLLCGESFLWQVILMNCSPEQRLVTWDSTLCRSVCKSSWDRRRKKSRISTGRKSCPPFLLHRAYLLLKPSCQWHQYGSTQGDHTKCSSEKSIGKQISGYQGFYPKWSSTYRRQTSQPFLGKKMKSELSRRQITQDLPDPGGTAEEMQTIKVSKVIKNITAFL